MKKCVKCNYENVDYANNCVNCGNPFDEEETAVKPVDQNIPENYNQQYNNEQYNNQQYNNQQYNNQQQYNQQYNNPQYNNQQVKPQNQKSKAIGLILNILVVGLGYAYVGKWGEGIVLFVVYLLMWILGFALFIPWIIAIGLWIYSLIKTNNMIDNYNNGLPY